MRTATHSLLLALALAACVQPESGINRASLDGTVVVEPTSENEKGSNDVIRNAQDIEMPTFGLHWVEATLEAFGADPDTGAITDGDVDWYELTFAETSYAAPVAAWFPAPEASADGEDALVVRIELRQLVVDDEDTESWEVLSEEDLELAAAGPTEVPVDWAFEKGETYRFAISGVAGGAEAPYRLVLRGIHPDDAHLLAGAYLTDDPTRRVPVGGAEVRPFAFDDETWVYTAEYTMDLFREVSTVPNPLPGLVGPDHAGMLGIDELSTSTTVVEEVDEVYVFAGNWLNLYGALPAGTWYSDTPVLVSLVSDHPEALVDEDGELSPFVENSADPVVVNAFAPLVIGWEKDEVEPNDVPVDIGNGEIDVTAPGYQDLGSLSGTGLVDIVRGIQPFDSDVADWVHDVDGFKFQVPETLMMFFTLDWDNGDTDLDILIFDEDGEFLDYGYVNKPEVNVYGDAVYEPGIEYYLAVIGYAGPVGTDVNYELRLEQVAP